MPNRNPIWSDLRQSITDRGYVVYQWVKFGELVVGVHPVAPNTERFEVREPIGAGQPRDLAILGALALLAAQIDQEC